ncbi:hypothetical protein COLO4_28953 [Corchorus olitorius]|uniref:Uncharacterized protein n=1 Tax=Corchorus olitorius TaxID=93759 RepID=A0A1R3HHB4_9ROSI|nr:hypothetical protein COLO4_28953 [Corchorus olitorius]
MYQSINKLKPHFVSSFPDEFIPLIPNTGCKYSVGPNAVGAQTIPGIGLSPVGPIANDAGSKGKGLQTSLLRGKAKKAISSGPSRIKNNITTEESVESYDPDSPFVFGAGVSDGRKIRKWKKTARSIQAGSIDLLCQEALGSVGQKRATGFTGAYLYSMGGKVKRFREADMEVSEAEENRDEEADSG